VLVDDILSTGHTMAEAARLFTRAGYPAPIAVAVHAVFADGAADALAAAGIARVVTTDTIPHATNAIALADVLGEAVRALLGGEA
jgi:ribose-phosphate pyrophosphokinase